MEEVVVIGGGASGLVAAIFAAKKGKKVTILERNGQCGKKILMTGNGRCNYFNDDQRLECYDTNNTNILKQIITKFNQDSILSFFESIGIFPRIKNHYYYPYSNQAVSVKEALLLEARLLHVCIKTDTVVKEVVKEKNRFIINPHHEHIKAKYIVLATGSKAAPKTGSDGIGYNIASFFGHQIRPVLPSLVPLVGTGSYLKLWAGIRVSSCITLYIDGKKSREEEGEIQLTEYGISGICTFNISGQASLALKQNKKVEVCIDFLPCIKGLDENAWIQWLTKRNELVSGRNLEQLLEGMLPYKLVFVLLKLCNIPSTKEWSALSLSSKKNLAQTLKQFTFHVTDTQSFDKAQVCIGGIPLTEINPSTMESCLCENLYIVGELLDVTGICGGYNLSFAWISGMIAGKHIGEEK